MGHAMARLILARHAAPLKSPELPPWEWPLAPGAVRPARLLARRLEAYAVDVVVSSRERKAIETAAIVAQRLGRTTRAREGLHEQDRTGCPLLEPEAFGRTMRRVFERPSELVLGRETAEQALARFEAAVGAVVRESGEATVAIVCHGTVISLFAERVAGVPAYALWRRLGMPAFLVFSRPSLALEEVVASVE